MRPQARDNLDESALYDWMANNLEGFAGPATLEKFAEGQSNPTYCIRTPQSAYVLRRQPFGELLPSAHAVDREFRLMGTLYPLGFPVPKPLCFCQDRGVIGAVFYLMEMVHGRTLADGGLPGFSRAERRAVYEAMTDTLASLHAINPDQAGLADYGRPGNYFERQMTRWIKQYRAAETERIVAMEYLIEVLPEHIPRQSRRSIVHGDFRIDNLIFQKAEPTVRAVIDWELSTLGDPLADFSYFALNWVADTNGQASVVALNLDALGIPSLEETVARYCERSKRDALPDLNWYFAYGLFRMASIVQGIKRRAREGNASNERADGMASRVLGLAETGSSFAARVVVG
jgi:aminoglycoside phosphotransferase (APT) family kinase protein